MLPRPVRAVAGVVVVLVATPVAITRAEPAAPIPITEPSFIARVLERSPSKHAIDERPRAARAQVAATAIWPNPTLSYEREAVPGLEQVDDFVRVGLTLDVSGRRGLARAAAAAGADAERFDAERATFVLANDARRAYLDAAYAREQLERLEAARAALGELVDVLASRARQGDASSYDADRAALELELLDDERATALRELRVAQLRLGAFLGEPATPYAARDPLALPAPPATLSSAERPDVRAALARATQAERDAAAAARTWIPRFELIGGMMASTSMGREGIGYVVGIAGDLPLFDRGGRVRARARADARRWRSEALALANDAQGDTVRAHQDLVLRIAQAERYLAGPARRAADLARRATVAYREGDRPILELLDVQRNARQTALRALELVYEARRAELLLRRAAGRDR